MTNLTRASNCRLKLAKSALVMSTMIDDCQMVCHIRNPPAKLKDVLAQEAAEALQIGRDLIKLHVPTRQSAEGLG